MSVIGSNILAGASGQGGDYTIERSLRFRPDATAQLSKNISTTATDRKKFTFSTWIKRTSESTGVQVIANHTGDDWIYFYNNKLYFEFTGALLATNQVFRDQSSWYHIMCVCDTTQATSTDRMKIYVNGSQVTSFATNTPPALNYQSTFMTTGNNYIGCYNAIYYLFDGYMAETHHIDGQALTPSDFGAYSASTGVWQPKKYAGTYGTNGFYLPFSDNASTTTLGSDFSGNGNNWTTNNISLTAGSTYDSMTDVPTLTSATAANYCTWNPLSATGSPTISNANLSFSGGATSIIRGTIGGTGNKFYWEIVSGTTVSSGTPLIFAIANIEGLPAAHDSWKQAAYLYSDSTSGSALNHYQNGSLVQTITLPASLRSISSGNILQVAYDGVTGKVWLGVNNVWADNSGGTTGNPSSGTNQTFTLTDTSIPMTPTKEHAGYAWEGSLNCGQRPFAYTPPTGFVALNTFNLPTPTIGATASTQANKYMDATTYTGNGSSRSIVNSGGMQPDLVWIKHRSSAENNNIYDSLRGAGYRLESNSTATEFYYSDRLTSFNSDGFSLGTGYNNTNGTTYVAWQWDAGTSTVTNTSGSISSQVRANQSAGFSVVTYTGNATSGATVGHGLGVAPKMFIVKHRNSGVPHDWRVYHDSLGNTKNLQLSLTDAAQTSSATWNNTSPSSTVFTLGSGGATNESGTNYVAYCFAEVAGYSKFGSYVGNGSTDGTFVNLGFRPKYLLTKPSSTTGSWTCYDTSRDLVNVADRRIEVNAADAEYNNGNGLIDFVSNGFKCRVNHPSNNSSGVTYIYMAFAEVPAKFSLAR